MLHVYHIEVEDDQTASQVLQALTLPEGVDATEGFSYGQGPAYVIVLAQREVTREELGVPEGRELVSSPMLDIAPSAAKALLEALDPGAPWEVLADGEQE